MSKRVLLFIGISLLVWINLNGQGYYCDESDPFCTGSIYTFPAGTTGSAESGAYYGCLTTQPAPAWYHMLIDNPGPITIYMYSTPLVDIDFICWGPYPDPYSPCVTGLTANKVVDCSYSPNPTEYCDIPNGQTGQYYILLITNYSQDPCEITFSQTGGSGSTDCTILPPPVGNNGPLCVGETLYLYADTIPNASYLWSGPAGFISTLQNPIILNVNLINAGNYSCIITVNGQNSDPAITNVVIHSVPTAALVSNDTVVCTGDAVYAIMNFTGWGPFKVTYNNGSSTFVATGLYAPQDTIFLYPTAPTTYSFTKVEDLNCERVMLFTTLHADTYPVTSGVLSGSGTICSGEAAELTFTLTGTPPWNITYTANGGNPQNVAANISPFILEVYPTTNTNYAFSSLVDLHCDGETSGQAVISVDPSPTANAGNDKTISYGTTTTLSGLASNGSGNYQYAWAPANLLANPNIQNPTTLNLTATTLFTLTATDLTGGCYDTDDILVTVTGGALGAVPTATPPVICAGEISQLNALASGGSGSYNYMWSSDPPGFGSGISNPSVQPDVTTTYSVMINDGFNSITKSVTVNVDPLPVPDAGANISIPNGTITTLQGSATAGSGNYSYHWEPADSLENANVQNPVTKKLYTSNMFSLYVTDLTTGCEAASPGQMTVLVASDVLTVDAWVTPADVCIGDSAQLTALASGGAGNYTYSWVSSYGFSSLLQNPKIKPPYTGVIYFTCTVNDGFNEDDYTVAVNVLSVPIISFGFGDTTVCVYDSLVLDAGVANGYLWSNGSTERSIRVATTGIGFDIQTHSVSVTNLAGCVSEKEIVITFDFTACTGIAGNDSEQPFQLYPNPGNGNLKIVFEEGIPDAVISASNILGQTVWGPFRFSDPVRNENILLDLGNKPQGIYFIHVNTGNLGLFSSKYILKK